MLSRRQFVSSAAAFAASPFVGIQASLANDLPPQLQDSQKQLYNFIKSIAEGEGLSGSQKLVLNSTIVPFDIAQETPYYNEEVFRQYADRTFHGGIEGLREASPASQAERFSSQYLAVMNLAARQVDQNHPEIANSLNELNRQLDTASEKFNQKLDSLEALWKATVASRNLKEGTPEYDLQRVTWMAQIRWADQMARLSEAIDFINLNIDSVRRRVYKQNEMALLDNITLLGKAYNVNRPWTAQTERSYAASGKPLTDILLNDPKELHPAMFDSSPLILPVGDLRQFLSGSGERGFDTSSFSSQTDSGTDSWTASGGARFLGWSVGGGGSGSSSFSRSVSKLNAIAIKFENIADYFIDRSAWFNPAILQDPDTQKLVRGRRELSNLGYVAVSLIIARGLSLDLKFSEKVNASDWSQSAISAGGGATFFGCAFNASGSRSSTRSTIKVDENGTTVTFKDGSNVCRVLGARVEPFMAGSISPVATSERIHDLAARDASFNAEYQALLKGKADYIDVQKSKIMILEKGLAASK